MVQYGAIIKTVGFLDMKDLTANLDPRSEIFWPIITLYPLGSTLGKPSGGPYDLPLQS